MFEVKLLQGGDTFLTLWVIPASSLVHLLSDTLYKTYEGHIYRIHIFIFESLLLSLYITRIAACSLYISYVIVWLFRGHILFKICAYFTVFDGFAGICIYFFLGAKTERVTHKCYKNTFSSVENLFPFL